ncbi:MULTISPECIES: hydrolase [unclassified Arsukibacterium]|uniref:hydrolase n=1 Tax=unclassified Arsukibacterium TaxID=2635278 RepID=UPI000C980DA6|nr:MULTISPECIES: hydrolase [unclassified Arsukibacterium]MAA95122.1 hydrolase [Rheinheimera sp.]HAW94427.1 hydrolase [Candidatus Azambacteria bacterium]|tara:strand:+ start:1516 stop:2061 length:546 start_codon:yes stop_codon:yes gene_type:complete
MLLQATDSMVLLIDIQQKLAPAISDTKQVEQAAAWVLQVALQLDIPLLATEQYPQGLGHTVPSLRELLPDDAVLEKIHFSAYREPAIVQRLQQLNRRQIVVIGTESHVCVLQSVLDLLAAGYQVFVVTEAVGSRTADNKRLALSRMQQAGCQIISKEMLAFEWLERADHDSFRQLSKGWIR